jgi:hypothetical protein
MRQRRRRIGGAGRARANVIPSVSEGPGRAGGTTSAPPARQVPRYARDDKQFVTRQIAEARRVPGGVELIVEPRQLPLTQEER